MRDDGGRGSIIVQNCVKSLMDDPLAHFSPLFLLQNASLGLTLYNKCPKCSLRYVQEGIFTCTWYFIAGYFELKIFKLLFLVILILHEEFVWLNLTPPSAGLWCVWVKIPHSDVKRGHYTVTPSKIVHNWTVNKNQGENCNRRSILAVQHL